MELSSGLDQHLYVPIDVRGKSFSAPTPFCFLMKVEVVVIANA